MFARLSDWVKHFVISWPSPPHKKAHNLDQTMKMHFPLIVGRPAQFIGLYEGHRQQITDYLNISDRLSSVSPDKDVIAVTVEGLITQQAAFRSQITDMSGV